MNELLNELGRAYQYFLANQAEFWDNLATHLQLSLSALLIALVVCIPLGVWAAKRVVVSQVTINTANALRVVPSLAVLFLARPYFGLGFPSALIALTILALPPILTNTYAGFRSLDSAVSESARGMGMSSWQVIRSVEFPLALPVIVAGIRIATVEVLASATLAAYIGGDGLGNFIQRGFAVNRLDIILVGTVTVALLALAADALLAGIQRTSAAYARV